MTCPRFTLETSFKLKIFQQILGHELHRHFTTKPRINSPVDEGHPTPADFFLQFVSAYFLWSHRNAPISANEKKIFYLKTGVLSGR